MVAIATSASILALFFLGGGEVILVLALVLVLLGAKKLPDITRGLGQGFYEFRKHAGDLTKRLDQEAHDAGESLGGIYGRPAAQALTPDNQVAELYNPSVFEKRGGSKRGRFWQFFQTCRLIWRRLSKCISALFRHSDLKK